MIMTLTEKAAYLKGLAEGISLDADKPETKLINAMLDLIGDLTQAVSKLEETTDTLHDYIEDIDEDLGEVEEFIMYEFGDDDDDEDDDDFDEDDDDEDYYEITCPSCGEVICFDETVDPSDLVCPACHEHFDCICDCEDCDDCEDLDKLEG